MNLISIAQLLFYLFKSAVFLCLSYADWVETVLILVKCKERNQK